MSLFDSKADGSMPLAARMRPRTLDEFVGQEHLVAPGRALRAAIEGDGVRSLILCGPPGTGKTTLAMLIARQTRSHVEQVNAVTAGVADLRRVITAARDRRRFHGQRTLLIVDEIHRFNRAQQDVLLPHVEDGTLILIGATTGNPFYDVNATLLSRSQVARLEPLGEPEIGTIVERALADPAGLRDLHVEIEPEAMSRLASISNGDARIALNALETAVAAAQPVSGRRLVTRMLVEEAGRLRTLSYDRAGDAHYDAVSAFIKSLRGSDPDAAVYWLARMLAGGEDPRFVARRMVVHAAEDVGLADPMALVVAVAAAHAVEIVGLPEARIPMAEAAIYIAAAPKSNAVVMAIGEAARDVEERRLAPVPVHLRDSSHPGAASRMGHGAGYLYPHDHPGGFITQRYLPEGLEDRHYYHPTEHGGEASVRARLRELWGDRGQDAQDQDRPDEESG